MRPITTLARPLVAAPYIMTGLETLRDPQRRAEQVGPAIKPIADRLEWLPTKDPETLVRIEGAISVGTGMLLLSGRFRRMTSLMLAAQLLPALAAEHRYWTEDDPERRGSERSHLLKNAGLFGALLMVATEPRRSARTAEVRRAVKEARIKAGAESRVMRREKAAEIREVRREAARQVRDARRRGSLGAAMAARTAAGAAAGAKLGKAVGKRKGKAAGMGKAAEFAKAAGIGKAASMKRKPSRGRPSGMAPIAKVARPAGAMATSAGTKAATAVKQRSNQAAKAIKH